jgi:murein DD-endopeptidase MepM/ murein hydrolase activator NlpD
LAKNEDQIPEHKVEAARIKKKTTRASAKKADTLSDIAVKPHTARTKRPSLILYTLYFIYRNLYVLGISLLRYRLRVIRRMRLGFARWKGSVYAQRHRLFLWSQRVFRELQRRVEAPLLLIRDAYKLQSKEIARRKAEKRFVLPAYLPVAEQILRQSWKVVSTIINYGVPIVAGWYLFTTVSTLINQPVGLRLEYNGQVLGYVQSEARFDDATQIIRDRMMSNSTEQFTTDIPTFTLEQIGTRLVRLIESSDLADMIFRTSDQEFTEAYGFYVGGRFIGAVSDEDKDAVLRELNIILAENVTGRRDEEVQFSKSIRMTTASPYPDSSMRSAEYVIGIIRSNEDEERTYIVEEGDSPSLIADKTNMPYSQLLQLNPGIEDALFVGDEILVSGARPYLPVETIYTTEYQEEVPYETIETENALYARGYSNVTQEGVNGLQLVTAEITLENGIETGRDVLSTIPLIEPIPAHVTIGVNNPQPSTVSAAASGSPASSAGRASSSAVSDTGFIWPTVSGSADTYPGHPGNGIDIAPGGAGHNIYASAAGTVVLVEYKWVNYGHQIIIDHGNGFQTRYAHNSEIYVSVGDQVAQGQVIAAMGRTGRATGNHLHFEVLLYGVPQWPPDYVGYSG